MPESDHTRVEGGLRLPAARRRLSGRAVIVLNLSLSVASGTVICFWVWYYTDWIEEFGAVLTLGGALSWLAVMLRIIPEDRIKTVQEAFFSAAFEGHGALPWQGLFMAAAAAATSCFATVQIESARESSDRFVVVAGEKEAKQGDFWSSRMEAVDFDVLQPGRRLRVAVPVWAWRRKFAVAVSGYPEKTVWLRPWERRDLIAPSSFRRPVILLRPTAKLIENHQMVARKLFLRRANNEREIPFEGRSLWIGCGRSVEVPAVLREEWQKESGWAEHSQEWLFPEAWAEGGGDLAKGEKIEIAVRAPNGEKKWISFVVDFDATRLDFSPQVVAIGPP